MVTIWSAQSCDAGYAHAPRWCCCLPLLRSRIASFPILRGGKRAQVPRLRPVRDRTLVGQGTATDRSFAPRAPRDLGSARRAYKPTACDLCVAAMRSNASSKFVEIERLHKIIVRAGVQTANTITNPVVSSQNNDSCCATGLAIASENVETVPLR